jgi:hypothetical protein
MDALIALAILHVTHAILATLITRPLQTAILVLVVVQHVM